MELDSFLLDKAKDFKVKGNIFYEKSLQEQTDEKIQQITADRKSGAIEYTRTTFDESGEPETETILKIPNSIGITRFLTEVNLENGNPLITKFDSDEWRRNRIAAYNSGQPVYDINDNDLQEYRKRTGKTTEEMVQMEIDS